MRHNQKLPVIFLRACKTRSAIERKGASECIRYGDMRNGKSETQTKAPGVCMCYGVSHKCQRARVRVCVRLPLRFCVIIQISQQTQHQQLMMTMQATENVKKEIRRDEEKKTCPCSQMIFCSITMSVSLDLLISASIFRLCFRILQ